MNPQIPTTTTTPTTIPTTTPSGQEDLIQTTSTTADGHEAPVQQQVGSGPENGLLPVSAEQQQEGLSVEALVGMILGDIEKVANEVGGQEEADTSSLKDVISETKFMLEELSVDKDLLLQHAGVSERIAQKYSSLGDFGIIAAQQQLIRKESFERQAKALAELFNQQQKKTSLLFSLLNSEHQHQQQREREQIKEIEKKRANYSISYSEISETTQRIDKLKSELDGLEVESWEEEIVDKKVNLGVCEQEFVVEVHKYNWLRSQYYENVFEPIIKGLQQLEEERELERKKAKEILGDSPLERTSAYAGFLVPPTPMSYEI